MTDNESEMLHDIVHFDHKLTLDQNVIMLTLCLQLIKRYYSLRGMSTAHASHLLFKINFRQALSRLLL